MGLNQWDIPHVRNYGLRHTAYQENSTPTALDSLEPQFLSIPFWENLQWIYLTHFSEWLGCEVPQISSHYDLKYIEGAFFLNFGNFFFLIIFIYLFIYFILFFYI